MPGGLIFQLHDVVVWVLCEDAAAAAAAAVAARGAPTHTIYR